MGGRQWHIFALKRAALIWRVRRREVFILLPDSVRKNARLLAGTFVASLGALAESW